MGSVRAMSGMNQEKDRPVPVISLRRILPLLLLAVGLGICLWFGLPEYISLEALRENRVWLLAQVADHRAAALGLYVLAYIAAAALSLPGAAIFTMAAGFLFGQVLGSIAAIFAAALGATLVFMVAKTSLGDALRARAGPWLSRMADGFAANAFSYLLVLRLIPVFPFFVVNLVPAFLGVRLRTYVTATFLGMIPGGFVYASVGAGLGHIFESGGDISLEAVLTPEIVTALVGLALLALLSIGYKAIVARRNRTRR
jgi:uncharacterized membrane protein YdjX (TVP38/TMEM64 family)